MAMARLAWRKLPTRGGLLAVGAGLLLVVGVPYAAYLSVTKEGNFATTITLMRSYAAEAFFVFVMLGAIAPRGLYYRPAELALLFPAPIPRRQLVLYNIVWRARMSVLSALWLAMLGVMGGTPVLVALAGYTLILLLLQVSSQCFAVVRARLAERPRAAYGIKVGVASVLAIAALLGGLGGLLSRLAWTTRPALEILSADSLIDAFPWIAIAGGTVAALVVATCWMDGAYHETALARSLDRSRRKKRRGGGSYGPGARFATLKIPSFPYLRGAGPIAWRQCTELLRNPRRIVLVLAVVAAAAFGAMLLVQLEAGNDLTTITGPMRAWVVIFVLCIAPLLSGDSLGYDFRRDLDRMATLKSLPVAPAVLSAGQIAPATMFVTTVQALGICGVAVFTDSIDYATVLATLAVLIPMNWCVIAAENTLFLVAPYRTVVDDPGDMTFAGRLALATTLKMVSLFTLALLAIAVGLGALHLTHGSPGASVAALSMVLFVACVPATRTAGWAFRRFDTGRDVPV